MAEQSPKDKPDIAASAAQPAETASERAAKRLAEAREKRLAEAKAAREAEALAQRRKEADAKAAAEARSDGASADAAVPQQKKPSAADEEYSYDIPEVRTTFLRFRHYVLILTFLLIVVLPVAAAGWMSWTFAGSLRQVTVSVTVQEHALGSFGATDGGLSLQSAFRGSGGEETAIVRQLVRSEDFYRTIAQQMDLSEVWPEDRPVPFWPPRYDADGTFERGHGFWQNMVQVHIGSRDQIIRISVTAFDQQSAERVIAAIQAEAERRLNVARTATLRIALEESARRVEELREEYAEDSQRLLEFRLQNDTIDPKVLVGLNAAFTNFLRSMLAEEAIRIAEATSSVAQGGDLTRQSEDRVAAINNYLAEGEAAQGRVITADEVSGLIAEYQPLLTEAELSRTALRMAELSQRRFAADLQSNKVFLTSVTGGSMASIIVFPQFLPTLLLAAIACIVAWVIILIIFYAIRDRK